jgi:hypothetical protein
MTENKEELVVIENKTFQTEIEYNISQKFLSFFLTSMFSTNITS